MGINKFKKMDSKRPLENTCVQDHTCSGKLPKVNPQNKKGRHRVGPIFVFATHFPTSAPDPKNDSTTITGLICQRFSYLEIDAGMHTKSIIAVGNPEQIQKKSV